MSPDWADKPEDVPYAKMDDPQSLNLYGYVGNNPLSKADPDGHNPCVCELYTRLIDATKDAIGAAAHDVMHPREALMSFAVGTAALGVKALSAVSGAAPDAPPAAPAATGAKAPPNPNGSKGAPDHQAGVQEEADKARAAAGPGETVTEGKKIQVAGSTRQPDVQTVGADGKTKSVVEVERRPGSARNKAREAEYNSLGVNHTTVPLPPKPQP